MEEVLGWVSKYTCFKSLFRGVERSRNHILPSLTHFAKEKHHDSYDQTDKPSKCKSKTKAHRSRKLLYSPALNPQQNKANGLDKAQLWDKV